MKYALIRDDGITEIREDSYPLQENAFVLNENQANQLMSGFFILQNGEIIKNPNPVKEQLA